MVIMQLEWEKNELDEFHSNDVVCALRQRRRHAYMWKISFFLFTSKSCKKTSVWRLTTMFHRSVMKWRTFLMTQLMCVCADMSKWRFKGSGKLLVDFSTLINIKSTSWFKKFPAFFIYACMTGRGLVREYVNVAFISEILCEAEKLFCRSQKLTQDIQIAPLDEKLRD